MISRTHRFHGHNSLRSVYQHGQVARGSIIAVKVLANPRHRTWRAAVVVSRKINKSAVARNRMRRRLYGLIRELEPGIDQPFDIVITVFHNNLLEVPLHQLKDQLQKQLKELGVLDK